MISNQDKVNLVRFTYGICVRDLKSGHVIIRPIEETMQTFANCVSFYNLYDMTKQTLYDLMSIGLRVYPEDWLIKVFGNPYLPFRIAVGEKTRSLILRELPHVAIDNEPEVMVNRVSAMLSGFDRKIAKELVESGVMVGNDKHVQDRLLKRLANNGLVKAGNPEKENKWKWKKIKA